MKEERESARDSGILHLPAGSRTAKALPAAVYQKGKGENEQTPREGYTGKIASSTPERPTVRLGPF